MITIKLDILQTVGLGVLVFLLGSYIKSKLLFLQKYFIPAPVIGGLIVSLFIFFLYTANLANIVFNSVLQDFFMNIFFTCIGFTVSIAIIKKSGKQGAILAIAAVILLVFQNLIGVGLSYLFGINELFGIAMGSVSMSGGIGSAVAFGETMEELGATGAITIGVAAATFGLLAGSLVGGPVAQRLITKHKLKSEITNISDKETNSVLPLNEKNLFNSVMLVLVAAGFGSLISLALKYTGITFPYYVGCLFAGAILTNFMEYKKISFRIQEIDIIGNISLNLFLSMTLMSLNISKLVGLAGPMIVILLAQTIFMAIFAIYATFVFMGRNYDAAVMAAGHCGVGLGQTPNAIANMAAVIEKNGPAPNAWFVLPVITVVFINLCNPIIIMAFINMFK